MLLLWLVEELNIDHSDVFVLGLFCVCIIIVILYFQLGFLVAGGNKYHVCREQQSVCHPIFDICTAKFDICTTPFVFSTLEHRTLNVQCSMFNVQCSMFQY